MARTPAHFVHHRRAQARHNFGISVDWRDGVFATYKPDPDWRDLLDPASARRPFWRLDGRFCPHEKRLQFPALSRISERPQ